MFDKIDASDVKSYTGEYPSVNVDMLFSDNTVAYSDSVLQCYSASP